MVAREETSAHRRVRAALQGREVGAAAGDEGRQAAARWREFSARSTLREHRRRAEGKGQLEPAYLLLCRVLVGKVCAPLPASGYTTPPLLLLAGGDVRAPFASALATTHPWTEGDAGAGPRGEHNGGGAHRGWVRGLHLR